MKRSPGPSSPLGGGTPKRFEKMRSSPQMHLHQQYHQQMQNHQQQQHNGPLSNSHQPYYHSVSSSPSGMGIMPYNRNVPPPGSYMFNHAPVGMPRMWNYSVPPPPTPIRPPLPRGPPASAMAALPPPPQPPPLDKDHSNNLSMKNKPPPPPKPGMEEDDSQTVVNKKPKRKSMSSRYGCPKEWVREDAIKAIALEEEYSKRSTKAPTLLLRFPDPELNRDIISKYSTDIESVHFQQNSAPRYCFVHLKEGADVDQAIDTISKIPFGTGFVSAELKRVPASVTSPSNPDEVDPYTLYIGNLPTTISSHTVKDHFPGAHRIDIGFAQRMKYTRYAFVRYDTVEEAMEAFKRSVNTLIESRSLIVRFRRQRSTIASGEPVPKKDAQSPIDMDEKRDSLEEKIRQDAARGKRMAELPKLKGYDSPTSFEDPEIIDLAKSIARSDAERWGRKSQEPPAKRANNYRETTNGSGRRNSLEAMFNELERNSPISSVVSTTQPLHIKEEKKNDDDDLSDDEIPANNLLGLRYTDSSVQIKTEPDDEVTTNHNEDRFQEDFDYDEDINLDPEEAEDNWAATSKSHQNPDSSVGSWEILRQQELSTTEKKPDVEQLRAQIEESASSTSHPPPPFTGSGQGGHATFMETLYEQVRRAKEKESSSRKRTRDDLDDMFAQMNSDVEEEDDYF